MTVIECCRLMFYGYYLRMEIMTNEELKEVFRANLISRRRELKMTQIELAKACGVSQPTISHFESGEIIPSLETLAELARALETKPHALLSPEIFSSISH